MKEIQWKWSRELLMGVSGGSLHRVHSDKMLNVKIYKDKKEGSLARGWHSGEALLFLSF